MTQRLIGELIGNRYRLTFHISEGGYGNVYKAVDTQLNDQLVAVKLLRSPPPDADEEYYRKLQRRFMDEARVSALLGEHPGIVQVKSYGVHQQRPYLVMEYLNAKPWLGQGLDYVLHREGVMDPERVVRLAQQICAALHHAHRFHVDLGKHSIRGVVHRDIKPSNIFVQRNSDGLERVKLLDFGISKLLGDNTRGLTQAGYFLGTMCYASPEQMRGETLDARSDIYSLGVVLYELMTGQLPLMPENDSLPGWYHVHNFEDPIPFYEQILDYPIPEALQAVVMGCLEKEPDNRPGSAQILEELLRASLDPVPHSSPPQASPAASPSPPPQPEPELFNTFDPPTDAYIEEPTPPIPGGELPSQPRSSSLPSDHNVRFQQALELIQQRDHRGAIQVLNQLIQEEPNEERYYLQRGMAHLRQGHWGLAQMDFQGALRLDPDYPEAQRGLRDALAQVGLDELSISPTEEVDTPAPVAPLEANSFKGQLGIWGQWVGANGVAYGLAAALSLGIARFRTGEGISILVYGAAIGSLIGAWVGAAQWVILRRYLDRIRGWVLITALAHLVSFLTVAGLTLSDRFPLTLMDLVLLTSPVWGLALGGWVNLCQLHRWWPSPWAFAWVGAGVIEMGMAALLLSQISRQANVILLVILLGLLGSRPLSGGVLLKLLDQQRESPFEKLL